MTRAYMLRVEVGAHYTDGRNLWTVTGTNQLGSVDLENAASGAPRTMGSAATRKKGVDDAADMLEREAGS